MKISDQSCRAKPVPTEDTSMVKFSRERDWSVSALAVGAALCAVPISIAVSEIFLGIALAARLVTFARERMVFWPPREFWFWLAWAWLETVAWLHSPDLGAGYGEMRHLLLIGALLATLPALNHGVDKVRLWKGIIATATFGSLSLIVAFAFRMIRYRRELVA